MRITFHKISDERHALELTRGDGRRERVECETRSYLRHDLLHYAVESEAGVRSGLWGSLARGKTLAKTLAEMNDREGQAMASGSDEMAAVEQLVGALHGAEKLGPAAEVVAGMRRFAASLGATLPPWFTAELVAAVQERMRQLVGRWRATAYGSAMDLEWQDGPPPADRG
jgi:hypothetical protein